jgi:NAD(P)-dependent dehydrogenase (short-subunit alcohol dehydrogenase family)
MALSFVSSKQLSDTPHVRRKVLVTGAGGNIGSYFSQHSADRYDLRLMVFGDDEKATVEALGVGEIVQGDVTNQAEIEKLCQGVDTVVHLAADPSPSADWATVLPVNIAGTYNVFRAAKLAGCRRVIYASSIHAVSGYPADVQVKTSDPVNPGDLYGVSKCFGEALARYMAEQENLSSIVIRIGAFQPEEKMEQEDALPLMDCFVSERDLTQLIQRSIDANEVQFAIVHGLSEGRFKRMDITTGREIFGYAPQDNFTEDNPAVAHLNLDEKVMSHSAARDAGETIAD